MYLVYDFHNNNGHMTNDVTNGGSLRLGVSLGANNGCKNIN